MGFPKKVIMAYLLIIVLSYIYFNHVVTIYGDVISGIPSHDIANNGKHILDGWGIVRIIIFAFLGYVNPHNYSSTLAVSVLVSMFNASMGNSVNNCVDPVLSMAGYSVGSMLAEDFTVGL
jgi:hypothetical protein